jgi:hypothetical protein
MARKRQTDKPLKTFCFRLAETQESAIRWAQELYQYTYPSEALRRIVNEWYETHARPTTEDKQQ